MNFRVRNGGDNEIYDPDGQYIEADGMLRATGVDANGTGEPSSSTSSVGVDSETVILSLKDRVRWLEQRLFEKVCRERNNNLFVRVLGIASFLPPVTVLSTLLSFANCLHPTSVGMECNGRLYGQVDRNIPCVFLN